MLKDTIKQARIMAGLKQKEVAERIGVIESTYCGYETGKREPNALKIKAIASALGVTGDFLLDIAPEKEKAAERVSPDEQQLVGFYRLMNAEGKEKVLRYAEDIAQIYK